MKEAVSTHANSKQGMAAPEVGAVVCPIVNVSLAYYFFVRMGIIRPQNLNDVFLAAANQAKQKLPELTHNQKVRL